MSVAFQVGFGVFPSGVGLFPLGLGVFHRVLNGTKMVLVVLGFFCFFQPVLVTVVSRGGCLFLAHPSSGEIKQDSPNVSDLVLFLLHLPIVPDCILISSTTAGY